MFGTDSYANHIFVVLLSFIVVYYATKAANIIYRQLQVQEHNKK